MAPSLSVDKVSEFSVMNVERAQAAPRGCGLGSRGSTETRLRPSVSGWASRQLAFPSAAPPHSYPWGWARDQRAGPGLRGGRLGQGEDPHTAAHLRPFPALLSAWTPSWALPSLSMNATSSRKPRPPALHPAHGAAPWC